jgi:hypothetical protein
MAATNIKIAPNNFHLIVLLESDTKTLHPL